MSLSDKLISGLAQASVYNVRHGDVRRLADLFQLLYRLDIIPHELRMPPYDLMVEAFSERHRR